jgi:hypothetical protein
MHTILPQPAELSLRFVGHLPPAKVATPISLHMRQGDADSAVPPTLRSAHPFRRIRPPGTQRTDPDDITLNLRLTLARPGS